MAVATLGDHGTEEDLRLITGCLTDPDEEVRLAAVRALSDRRAGFAVDALVALLHDPSEEIAKAAVNSLGYIRDERAVPHLIEALKDDSIAPEAAEALERFPTREARAAHRNWQRQAKA